MSKMRNTNAIAYYDTEASVLTLNGDPVSKAAELACCGRIHLANVYEFMRTHPEAGLDRYIAADHSEKVYENFDFYLAAYIHLSRFYSSFETLVENDFCRLIDTFIDACVSRNTDHPGTLCYFRYDIHKVLKLRKSVFDMFRKQLNDFNTHEIVYLLQNVVHLTDKQLREYRDEQKMRAAEMAAAEAERTPAAANLADAEEAMEKTA